MCNEMSDLNLFWMIGLNKLFRSNMNWCNNHRNGINFYSPRHLWFLSWAFGQLYLNLKLCITLPCSNRFTWTFPIHPLIVRNANFDEISQENESLDIDDNYTKTQITTTIFLEKKNLHINWMEMSAHDSEKLVFKSTDGIEIRCNLALIFFDNFLFRLTTIPCKDGKRTDCPSKILFLSSYGKDISTRI